MHKDCFEKNHWVGHRRVGGLLGSVEVVEETSTLDRKRQLQRELIEETPSNFTADL